jgi:hypothetical protein
MTTRELVALLLSAGAEHGMSFLQFESLVHVLVTEMLFFVKQCKLFACLCNFFSRIFRDPAQRKTSGNGDRRRISKWLLTQLSLMFDESQTALCSRGPSPRVELKFAP